MFAGAAMTETGGNKIIFLRQFSQKREKAGRMEGDSPVYQKITCKILCVSNRISISRN
jgi:hypothetical protein